MSSFGSHVYRGSLFYARLILLCIFAQTINCIDAAHGWRDAPASLVRPRVPRGNDPVDWSGLPSCAHKSCYVVFQTTVCPEGGLTKACFCYNKMGLSDHCLPSCSAEDIAQVEIWEARQCLYLDSREPVPKRNKYFERSISESESEPKPKNNSTTTPRTTKGSEGNVKGQASRIVM